MSGNRRESGMGGATRHQPLRSWYPRALRHPASVWDRLPPELRVMRTAIWLEFLVLPAGFLLDLFVLPTGRPACGCLLSSSPM